MKNKLCLLWICMMLLPSFCLAQSMLNFRGPIFHHRGTLTSNDLNAEQEVSGGVNSQLGGRFSHLNIYCKVSDSDSWTVSPMFWNSDAGEYYEASGLKQTAQGNFLFTIAIDQAENFYIKCDGQSGTNPEIDVYLQGVGRL